MSVSGVKISGRRRKAEWSKQVGRDGYSPLSKPVIRPVAQKDVECCERIIRFYCTEHESSQSRLHGGKASNDLAV